MVTAVLGLGVFALLAQSGMPDMMAILIISECIVAASAVVALLFVGSVLEGRRPPEFGFRTESALRHMAMGAALGAALPVAAAVLFALFGWYRIRGLETTASLTAFLQALLLFAMVAVFEEVVSRGIIFRIVEEGAGSAVALGVSSTIFGGLHLTNPNASASGVIGIAIGAGVLLGAAYMITRSLWMAIGIHWTWNLTEGTVLGFPVSGAEFPALTDAHIGGPEILTGGPFGPEAGLVLIGIAAASGVWLLTLAIRKGQWVPFRKPGVKRVSAPT